MRRGGFVTNSFFKPFCSRPAFGMDGSHRGDEKRLMLCRRGALLGC